MDKKEDKEELLERSGMAWKKWGVGIDEDLTLEERKMRWRLLERARAERAKGRAVVVTSRKLMVEGREWRWDTEDERWVVVRREV